MMNKWKWKILDVARVPESREAFIDLKLQRLRGIPDLVNFGEDLEAEIGTENWVLGTLRLENGTRRQSKRYLRLFAEASDDGEKLLVKGMFLRPKSSDCMTYPYKYPYHYRFEDVGTCGVFIIPSIRDVFVRKALEQKYKETHISSPADE